MYYPSLIPFILTNGHSSSLLTSEKWRLEGKNWNQIPMSTLIINTKMTYLIVSKPQRKSVKSSKTKYRRESFVGHFWRKWNSPYTSNFVLSPASKLSYPQPSVCIRIKTIDMPTYHRTWKGRQYIRKIPVSPQVGKSTSEQEPGETKKGIRPMISDWTWTKEIF